MLRQSLQIIRNLRTSSSSSIFTITPAAKSRLKEILYEKEYLRVKVDAGGCSGFSYEFNITDKYDPDNDLKVEDERVITDRDSLELIGGSVIDYRKELIRSSFVIAENPHATGGCSCGTSFSIDVSL